MRALLTYYYLSHFHEFIKFVTGLCEALLDSGDTQFIQYFNALTKPQQCLVVRFINRKSIFVKATSYAYEEIKNIVDNLNYLNKESWFTPNLIYKTKVASAYWQGNFEAHIRYFIYVYFGNFRSKFNQFSMRDLGVMRTRKEQAQVMARFDDIESAKSAFEIHSLLHEIRAQLPLLKRGAILKHLDNLPATLKTNQFYEFASEQIERRLSSTDTKAKLIQ
ncbi:MAG: DNA polymerase-3 subunit epsilon [Moritella dasanensis]